MALAMLYIFDLDDTLVETYGVQPLEGIPSQLVMLKDKGHVLAVATNQAGPAWGVATGDSKYPTPTALGKRFLEIADIMPALATAPWFVAVGDPRLSLSLLVYQDLIQAFKVATAPLDIRFSADATWRKPGPGMLLAACRHYSIEPEAAVFIGDYDADAEAAAAAGTQFVYIGDFV